MHRVTFEVGDLVACRYDLHHFFYCVFGPDDHAPIPVFYGIVVAREEGTPYFDEYIYEIYCTDGTYRYFLEDEVYTISWLTHS
jgi:hypothetical protein